MRYLPVILFILIIHFVNSSCQGGQIDINTASLERLDELYGIGPVKAQSIIESRAFESLDDLIKVSGIGEATLQKIKEQGLACVSEENQETEETEQDEDKEQIIDTKESHEESQEEPVLDEETKKPELQPIILTPKTINTENPQERLESNKSKYAVYGFCMFCFLLFFLFIIKSTKSKNEFR